MRKISKKAINAELPSLRCMDKYFIFHGDTGIVPETVRTVSMAVAEYNPAEEVSVIISIFAVGDICYTHEGYDTVDIHDILHDFRERRITRRETVDLIQGAILEDIRYNALYKAMDKGIRSEVEFYEKWDECPERFLREYQKRHKEKYGEELAV